VYGSSGQISLVNCTFANNTAEGEEGGGIRLISGGNTSITNCIFWGNEDDGGNDESAQIHYSGTMPAVDYSCIQGLTELEGTGNTGENPDFTDGLRLATNSPCIDAGDNNSVPADTTDLDNDGNTVEPIPYDLSGFPRFIDDCRTVDTGNGTAPIVDMGAYEFLNSDINSKGNVDFVDFCLFAAHWMDNNCGTCSGADLTCDGNVDEDDLRELVAYWLAGVP
jgi:parallel beta-helix repeat protein